MSFSYPSNIQFECDGCALCCADTERKNRCILLLESEANVISAQTNLQFEEFIQRVSNREPYKYELKKTSKGKCFFLKENRCTIYDHRPLVCRFYPFELKFDKDSGQYRFSYTLECPRINQGRLLKKEYFEKIFLLASKLLP